MTAGRDYLLDSGDEGDDAEQDSDSQSESAGSEDPKSPDKRIRDLQSQKDKETARANKAEKQLKAMLEAAKDPDAGVVNPPPAGGGGDVDGAVLEMARMFAYQQYPKLAEYDISPTDLDGSSPSEIARSAAALVARFEKIETKARNKVLAENGMAPEIEAGVPPTPQRDFSKMSKEDFNRLVDENMRGGAVR